MSKRSKVTVVWGGQFGSEGKGQIAAYIHQHEHFQYGVRVGGPNAGHTFYMASRDEQMYPEDDRQKSKVVVQSIPVVAMMGGQGVIGPAGLVLKEQLEKELREGYQLLGQPVQLLIDTNAAIITPEMMHVEQSDLTTRIGSTGEGVGAATAAKVMRGTEVTVGQCVNRLIEGWSGPEFAGITISVGSHHGLNAGLKRGDKVMLEGTQGYGLSLHTGGFFPFCTSRECTPQGIIAETGVGTHLAQDFESVMVLRTFPIRVGGNSGPLRGEITWERLSELTGGYVSQPEKTTVTKKNRRIAEFDWVLVKQAIDQCGPTCIALNFLDYVFPELASARSAADFPMKVVDYLSRFELNAGVPVKYVSWGADKTDMVGGLWK